MLANIIGILYFLVFCGLSLFLSKRKGYRAFLIAAIVISPVLGGLCGRFLSTGDTVDWVPGLFYSVPISSMLRLDDLKRNQKKQSGKQ